MPCKQLTPKNQGRRFGGGQAIYHQRTKQKAERVDRSLGGRRPKNLGAGELVTWPSLTMFLIRGGRSPEWV
jgi:hypothetical protein